MFFYAVVGLAVASMTDRRIVAGAVVIGLFLVTSITACFLARLDPDDRTSGSPPR